MGKQPKGWESLDTTHGGYSPLPEPDPNLLIEQLPGDSVPWGNPYPEGTLNHDFAELEHAWQPLHDAIVAMIEAAMIPVLEYMTRAIETFTEWWETR